ncbi:MAG: DNA-binding response regulator [Hydrocarboniphaga sp.]|uniref:response regulator transcription factor n=1 Tax=Hydrocarboniphaga sp. TaxID=2033016 RepID=UPI0026197D2E|nr:response regulator [Hydrocarboniphaga sp.]MDB5971347.1 DNA-binding response regulator [Hydrocarboniphaga sp.]
MSAQSEFGCVYVVDDDDAVRAGLRLLLGSCGLRSQGYTSAQAFLDAVPPGVDGCLLLDVRMPGMSGLDLQERMQAAGIELPVILLTGHGDVPMAVRAMKRGAHDFIQKPFNDQYLLDRVQEALQLSRRQIERRQLLQGLRERLGRLTAREQAVLDRLVLGQANKLIAAELGISERTVEVHRAHVMEKMEARTLAQLIQLMGELQRD